MAEIKNVDFTKIESKRKQSVLFFVLGLIIIIAAVVLFLLNPSMSSPLLYLFTFLALLGVILMIISGVIKNKLTSKFKNEFLVNHVASKYPGMTYIPDKGLPREYVEGLRLYKKADIYQSEDMFTGTISGVKFISSDVKMQEEHIQSDSNGTRTTYETFFEGRIAVFEFNKDINDTVLVSEGGTYIPSGVKKVDLESIDFNKKFKTYAKDAINAFYILTPEIILALLEIEKQNPGKIAVLFKDNKVVVCINNFVDTFSIKLNKKVDEKFISIIDRDINLLINLVNQLKLNKNVYKE